MALSLGFVCSVRDLDFPDQNSRLFVAGATAESSNNSMREKFKNVGWNNGCHTKESSAVVGGAAAQSSYTPYSSERASQKSVETAANFRVEATLL